MKNVCLSFLTIVLLLSCSKERIGESEVLNKTKVLNYKVEDTQLTFHQKKEI